MEHGNLNSVQRDDSIFTGAIFISNRETKHECLQRKLFGLPLSKLNFLKKVKAGMILFLFEHEERKLYGVFEATCDGALNIIPDAYRSTGQSYPAQILFERIWMCKPLCEDEFRSAIEENYYSRNKFHFGLSYKQVIKLIHLFHSRKIKINQYMGQVIPNKIIDKFENSALDDISLTKTERYFERRSDIRERNYEVRGQFKPKFSFDQFENTNTGRRSNQPNTLPSSYPQNSYSETLNSRHFSIEKTAEIEYKPSPPHSSQHKSELDDIAAGPYLIRSNHHSSLDTTPRMAMIQEEMPLTSLHDMNDSICQTRISQHASVSGAHPKQEFYCPNYILSAEESQRECFDRENQTYQRAEADEYAVVHPLNADSDLSRLSAFSRLSPYGTIRDHNTSELSRVLSLNEFLDSFSTRIDGWSAMELSKKSVDCDISEMHGSGYQHKITQLPVQLVERRQFDQYDDIIDSEHVKLSEPSNHVLTKESFELPFYDFRRRSTGQKYEVRDFSNECDDICGSQAELMENKKRRIVRPSFDDMHENLKAKAEKEKTEVEMSSIKFLESESESKVNVVNSFFDSMVPVLQNIRKKYEPVGGSHEQNNATSADESLDFIPID